EASAPALAAETASRPFWWLHEARNREEHHFREESRALLKELKDGHSYIQYSRPGPADQKGVDFDAAGRLAVSAFDKLGVPREGQFYLCSPSAFLRELTSGLAAWGVPADHVHTEIFGTLDSITPGMKPETHSPHLPAGLAGFGAQVSFSRGGRPLPLKPKNHSLLHLSEASGWPGAGSLRTGGAPHPATAPISAGRA